MGFLWNGFHQDKELNVKYYWLYLAAAVDVEVVAEVAASEVVVGAAAEAEESYHFWLFSFYEKIDSENYLIDIAYRKIF